MSERLLEIKHLDDGEMIYALNEVGKRIGQATITMPDERGICVLANIEIDKDERRKGTGSEMMSQVIRIAIESGAKVVVGKFRPEIGYEEKVRDFYERHGFSISRDGYLRKDLI